MKLAACIFFTILVVIFAFVSGINAQAVKGNNPGVCQGTEDLNCPAVLCSAAGIKGWKTQENGKPYPDCCGGPICA